MDIKERLRMINMLEHIQMNPEYASRLNLSNESMFHGKSYSEYVNVCTEDTRKFEKGGYAQK